MNNLGQGTTPYLQVAIDGCDLTAAEVIYVTIEQGQHRLNLTGERVNVLSEEGNSVVTVHLTQEETLAFKKGFAEIQVRWRDSEGDAFETEVLSVNFLKALYKGVI